MLIVIEILLTVAIVSLLHLILIEVNKIAGIIKGSGQAKRLSLSIARPEPK